MGKFVLENVRTFMNGTDLTGFSNKMEIAGQVDEKETTNFASGGYKEYIGGIGSATIAGEGQWSAGDITQPDDALYAVFGKVTVWTICPDSPTTAVGDVAWQVSALDSKYTIGGAIGDVAPWTAGASSSSPLVRGQIMHPAGTVRSSTGTGTALLIAGIPTGMAMWANLHVLSVAGTSTPSIAVKLQSDDNSGFTSPTDRGTFTTVTAANQAIGQTLKVAAVVTDTYWRVAYTITGGSPGFTFVVSLGLAPSA